MRKILIGVMGPGTEAIAFDQENAYELGSLIAAEGWILLTGGRNTGVMDAASRGAKAANGLTLGILPTADSQGISEAVDIAIFTDMGSARNNINVLSCDVIIACGIGSGTASEIALALKAKKPVLLLNKHSESQAFFKKLSPNQVHIVRNAEEAIALTRQLLKEKNLSD